MIRSKLNLLSSYLIHQLSRVGSLMWIESKCKFHERRSLYDSKSNSVAKRLRDCSQ